MKTYIVIYTEPGCVDWLFFRCQAEDADHAEEQCDNAYPGCGVVGIYLTDNAADALRQLRIENEWGETE